MYVAPHSAVGAALVVAGSQFGPVGLAVGIGAAFLSHPIVDLWGERGYPNLKSALIWEGQYAAILVLLSVITGSWLLLIGTLAATGMDLLDKKFGLVIFWPNKFSRLGWFHPYFHPPIFRLTLQETKLSAIISSIAIIFLATFM